MSQLYGAMTSGLTIPETLQEAINPTWLAAALAPVSGGAAIVAMEVAEVVKAMVSKVRIAVRFANEPDRAHHYCVKGFLDTDSTARAPGQSPPGNPGVTPRSHRTSVCAYRVARAR